MNADLLTTLPDDLRDRTTALNAGSPPSSPSYVLVWLQQTLRAWDNPAIDCGLALAAAANLPVLVYHGVRADYPYASDRLHSFLLEASRSLAQDLAQRGIACAQYVETSSYREKGLVYRLAEAAAVVVTDEHHVFVGRSQAVQFAAKVDRLVLTVDASRLVPTRQLDAALTTTPAFRKAHTALRPDYLAAARNLPVTSAPYDGSLPYEPVRLARFADNDIAKLVASCPIDHTLPRATQHPGGRDSALERLGTTAKDVVPRYKWTRNNPALDTSTSQLSPYMHFGVLGPREVAIRINEEDLPAAARWKFLDELLTWREWSHYQMFHEPELMKWRSLPSKARATLDDHAGDPRPLQASLRDLIHGETDDRIWNAAQRQWLGDGWMHNNLRMYWAKRIIALTASPQEAWALACYLNDRLSLDGRDPATYASMHWAFGRGKPAYREQDIYGWVAPKSSRALMKREGVEPWIEAMNEAEMPTITEPDLNELQTLYA